MEDKTIQKVAAILPAYNEETTISNVLKILQKSPELDEVIVVDDGSADKTAEIVKAYGAKVIKLLQNKGKGNALKVGLENTKAGIVIFFDADLIGLTSEHVSQLVKPVLENKVVMTIGLRERWGNLPAIMVKIDPLLAIGGERALRRFVFESIPPKFTEKFTVETALNFYCKINKLPVQYVKLKKLNIVTKEKKWGLKKGFLNRLKMYWQLLKIRILILKHKKEFICK